MEEKDKKTKILVKAEKLFAEHGFTGTSVREIAKAAEVNIAMISYYFGSKDKLLIEIFRHRSDYLKTKVDDLLNNASIPWWTKLDIFIDHYVQKFKSNQCLHQIMMREMNVNSNHEVFAYIMQLKKSHYEMIRHFIQQGQDSGAFNKEVDIIWLYTLLPGLTKHVLLNKDFMMDLIEDKTGTKPTEEALVQYTTEQLKQFIRKILEIK